MKIVLDTNVLVAGLLSPFNAPGEIVRMTSAGILQVCHDARILSEYASVLHRKKFNLNPDYVEALLEQIRTRGHHVSGVPLKKPLPDTTDEPFLEAAIAGRAAYLVTGNLKHFPHADRQGVSIVSPADFLTLYRKQ